jgi:hypothetical protein
MMILTPSVIPGSSSRFHGSLRSNRRGLTLTSGWPCHLTRKYQAATPIGTCAIMPETATKTL